MHPQEFVIGIGTLALINAGLAQTKNRSGLGWFPGSLFIGPVATLLLVLLGKIAPPTEVEEKRRSISRIFAGNDTKADRMVESNRLYVFEGKRTQPDHLGSANVQPSHLKFISP